MRLVSNSMKADFSHHPDSEKALLKNVKIVRFQENPAENWGPQRKAVTYQGKKGKEGAKVEGEPEKAAPEQDAKAVDVEMTDA